jgi:DNA helicase-2/ATP-dependent DNA helicase PcrA
MVDLREIAFVPRASAERRGPPSLVRVALDPAQRAAVEQPGDRALLVLGEAGHGKTTVALHRLAYLWNTRSRHGRRPLRAAVVVPTPGLVRLLQPLLRQLGVDVDVSTYDTWASGQARRAFRRLPRESDGASTSVMRVKRHPALRGALEELASREPGRIDDDDESAVRRRSGHATRGDLQHLFGDRALLERVAGEAKFSSQAVADVLDRTRVQFSLTAEDEWRHLIDRRRLRAVDGRRLDDGTASACATTVDVEDYAVLFELDRLRAARRGLPATPVRPYDLLVVDEAQEFAPLELALLGRSVAPTGNLVVAGDADQQTDGTTAFFGWPEAMRELGRTDYATVELEIGYRCPPDVVALARAVVGRSVPKADAAPSTSPAATLRSFPDEPSLAESLGRNLHVLLRLDPRASVAVVCRGPMTARRLAGRLAAMELPVRLVFDGRFLPRGPVQVSTVDEVKGLEFDFVVVPDAGTADYPDDTAARRAMYVALTRARHQAVLACVGGPSELLR